MVTALPTGSVKPCSTDREQRGKAKEEMGGEKKEGRRGGMK